MSKISQHDLLYKSKTGFFNVWRLAHSYAIYNNNGEKIAEFKSPYTEMFKDGKKPRAQRMAELAADALEFEFQL